MTKHFKVKKKSRMLTIHQHDTISIKKKKKGTLFKTER